MLLKGTMFTHKAVFLDRDGTVIDIVHRPDFVKKLTAPFRLEELQVKPDAVRIAAGLKELGFLRIMATNQPDVAQGYVDEKVWFFMHQFVTQVLQLDDVFMCRHVHSESCPFKKPLPGMLLAAADKWGIDLGASYMVGDSDADIDAGKAAGCTTILLDAFYNQDVRPDIRVAGLTEALAYISGK